MAVTKKKYDALRARMKREREQGREMLRTVVDTAEVSGSSFTHGFIEGYFGGLDVLGVPMPMISGTVLHAFGAFGLLPRDMHALGNGAFATSLSGYGAGLGMRLAAGEPADATASGRRLGVGRGPSPVSTSRLRAIAYG